MNFKQETLDAIKQSGHITDDVMFVGSKDTKLRMDFLKFLEVSDFNYDDGFGGQEIPTDLIVCFTDLTYMTRGEYDGSEWWEYNEPIDISLEFTSIDVIPLNSWASVRNGICPECGKAKSAYEYFCDTCSLKLKP